MAERSKSDWWRAVLGEYPTGVTLISALDPSGAPVGMVVGSFTAVSQDPPLIGFFPDATSTTFPLIAAAGRFSASVLGTTHEALCRAFVAKAPDRFEQGSFVRSPSGALRLSDSVAWPVKVPNGSTSSGFIQIGLGAQTGMLILASVAAGLLSDRLRRRKVFVCASAAFGAAGLVVFATATTVPQYIIGIGMIGLAQGTYYAVDLALVSDVLPDRDRNAAKDLGVLSIATQGPTALIPVFAPLLLAIPFGNVVSGSSTNYTALFVGSAVFALGAALAILRVRGSR